MDKQLTDEELVDILNICVDWDHPCEGCPLRNETKLSCMAILFKNTIDLINRRKAEIETMVKEQQELLKCIEKRS